MGFLARLWAALFGPATDPQPAPTQPAPGPPNPVAVLAALNAARARRNLPALAWHGGLAAVAQARAARQARLGLMQHFALTEVEAAVPGDAVGECVAYGQADGATVAADWLADPPHALICLGRYDLAGVGVAPGADGRLFWCLDVAG